MKIARQSKASVRAPPMAGPAAVPTRPAASHNLRPVRDAPGVQVANDASSAAAPPIACRGAEDEQDRRAIPRDRSPVRRPRTARIPMGRRGTRAAGQIASASTSA